LNKLPVQIQDGSKKRSSSIFDLLAEESFRRDTNPSAQQKSLHQQQFASQEQRNEIVLASIGCTFRDTSKQAKDNKEVDQFAEE